MTPVVYLMAMICFVGWFFFVLFGGIGLAAMPMDLLVGFTKRPQPIDVQEYAKQKLLLNERAQKLLQIAGQLGDDARARARPQDGGELCAAARAQFGGAIRRGNGRAIRDARPRRDASRAPLTAPQHPPPHRYRQFKQAVTF